MTVALGLVLGVGRPVEGRADRDLPMAETVGRARVSQAAPAAPAPVQFGPFREADLQAFVRTLQAAVKANRRSDVARLVKFPIRVATSRSAFLKSYARIMTPGVRAALAAVDPARPLAAQDAAIAVVGTKGVMIGRGVIWIDAPVDAPGVPRIIGINPE